MRAYEVQRQANDHRGDTAGLRIDSRDAYVGTVAQQTVSSTEVRPEDSEVMYLMSNSTAG